ncbi:MAG: hypothetical protein JWQ80_42 [Massilia sp.]|nr:hypothetical protein [Massilia sp.]
MSDNSSRNVPTTLEKNGLANTGGLNAGSLLDQSLARLTENQVQDLVEKASAEALRLEVKAREQNLDYVTGRKVVEDHIDTFEQLDKRGRLTRHAVTTDVKTGAGNMRIESKSGATCFVATAAYGEPNHPDVILLRRFRDEKLSASPIGRRFIAWYWRTGPKLARMIVWSPFLRRTARTALKPIVGVVKILLHFR